MSQTSQCFDVKSKLTVRSKNSRLSTLTKEDLQRYFKDKKEKLAEDSKSRISLISKSHFHQGKSVLEKLKNELTTPTQKVKDRLISAVKIRDEHSLINEEEERLYEQIDSEIEEISYKSEESDPNYIVDAPTVATSI